jgi:hypothetical protein
MIAKKVKDDVACIYKKVKTRPTLPQTKLMKKEERDSSINKSITRKSHTSTAKRKP